MSGIRKLIVCGGYLLAWILSLAAWIIQNNGFAGDGVYHFLNTYLLNEAGFRCYGQSKLIMWLKLIRVGISLYAGYWLIRDFFDRPTVR
ncbi:MAG: hypothetical protein HQL17_03495 [Candidatus Omnitrophica bacterium]|nr:hypothetical protein [Candidatus Omnitrophota bacterium]